MSEQISLKEIDGMLDNQQVDNQADSNVTEETPNETVTFSLADIDAMLDEGEKKPDFAAAKKASDALNGTGSVAKQPTAKTEQKVEQRNVEPKKTPDGEYERGEQQTYQDPRSGKDVATQTRWGKGVVEVEAPYASAVEDYDTGTTHAITPSGQSISQTSTGSRGQVVKDSEIIGINAGNDNMRVLVGWNFPGSSYSRLNLIPQGGIDWVKRNPNAYKEQLAELQGKSVQDAVGMYNKLAKGMDDLARVNPDSDTMARLYAIQEYVHAKDLGYIDNTDMRKDGQRYIYYNSYNGSPEIKAIMDSGRRFRVDDYLTKAKIAVQSHPLKSVVDIQGAIGELFTPQDKALAWVTAMDNWKRGEASSIEREYQRLLAEPLKQLHDEIVDRAADPSTAEYVFRSMGFGNDIVNAVLWAGRKLTGTSDKQGTLDLLREGNQKAQLDKFADNTFLNGAAGGLTMVANWAPAFASGFTTNAVMKGLGMSSGTMARIAGSTMLGRAARGAAFGTVNLPLFTYYDTVFDVFQNPQSGFGDVVSSFLDEETIRHSLAEAPTGAVLSPMAVLGEAFGRAVFKGNKYAAATTGFLGESLAFAGSSSIKKWMEVNERRKKGEDVSFSMKDVWDCTFESVGTLLAMKAGHWGMNGMQGRANTMKNAKGEKVDTEQRKSGADQFGNQGMTELSAFLYNPRQYAKEHGITDSTDMRSTALGKEWESFLSRYQKGEVKDVDANSVATAMWLIDGKAMLKPISYSTELSADGKTVFSYDSMGNLIEERSFKNREKAEKWQEELRYDAEKYDMAKLEAEAAQRENEMAMQRTLDTMFDEVAGQIPSTLANGEPDPNFNVNTRTEIYNIVANTKSALFILNNVEDLPAEVAEQYRRMVTVGTPFMERYDQLMAANRESLRNRENEGMLRDEVMKIIDKKPSERTAEEHQFMEAYRNSLREKFNETPYVGTAIIDGVEVYVKNDPSQNDKVYYQSADGSVKVVPSGDAMDFRAINPSIDPVREQLESLALQNREAIEAAKKEAQAKAEAETQANQQEIEKKKKNAPVIDVQQPEQTERTEQKVETPEPPKEEKQTGSNEVDSFIEKFGNIEIQPYGELNKTINYKSPIDALRLAKQVTSWFKKANNTEELNELIRGNNERSMSVDTWTELYRFFEMYKRGEITDADVERLIIPKDFAEQLQQGKKDGSETPSPSTETLQAETPEPPKEEKSEASPEGKIEEPKTEEEHRKVVEEEQKWLDEHQEADTAEREQHRQRKWASERALGLRDENNNVVEQTPTVEQPKELETKSPTAQTERKTEELAPAIEETPDMEITNEDLVKTTTLTEEDLADPEAGSLKRAARRKAEKQRDDAIAYSRGEIKDKPESFDYWKDRLGLEEPKAENAMKPVEDVVPEQQPKETENAKEGELQFGEETPEQREAREKQERVDKAASLRNRHAQLSEEIKQKQLEYRFMNDRKKQYQARKELEKLYDEIEGVEQQLKDTGEPMQVKRFERPAKKERTQHAARKAYDEMKKKYANDDEVMEILNNTDPQDIYEEIGVALGSSKLLFKSKGEGAGRKRGVAEETGWKWNDVKGMFQLFDNEKGQSVQNWAETFWADLDEGAKNKYSSADIANMMLDVLSGASTIGDLRNIVLANRVRQAEELLEHREKEEEYWRDMERHEQEMKNAEEEAMLEHIKDLAENFDEQEYNSKFADEILKEQRDDSTGSNRDLPQGERSGSGNDGRNGEAGERGTAGNRDNKDNTSVERPTGETGADSQEDGRESRGLDSQRVSQERAGLSAKEREIVNRVNAGINEAIDDLDAEIRDLEKKGDDDAAEAARLERDMLENSREDMIDDALDNYNYYEENKGNMTSYEKAAAERQQKSLADRKAKRMRELLEKLRDPNTSDVRRRAVVRQLADLGVDASGFLEGRNEIKEIEEVDDEVETPVEGVSVSKGRVELNAATLKDPVSREYLEQKMKDEGWSEEARKQFMQTLDDAAEVVLEMGKRYKRLGDWNKMEILSETDEVDYNPRWRLMNRKGQWIPNRSAFKKNGEYPWNIDLGTLCTKRESFDALVQLIAEKGMAQNLGPTQIEAIKELLKENDFLTACDICFNETKRARVISYANQISNNWRVVSEAIGVKDKMVGDPIALTQEQRNTLHRMAGRGYKSAFQELIPESERRQYKGEEKSGNEIDLGITASMMQRIAKQMLIDPTLVGKLKPETLITTEGMDWFLRTYGGHTDVNGILASAWGSGTPKPIEGFNLYDPLSWRDDYDQKKENPRWHEGLKSRPSINWLMNNGGFRAQSFTDYHPMLFLDYLQMFTDVGVRKLPIHIYTKVPALVKLFGGSGAKINMSLVPKMEDGVDAEHAGLKPDGKGGWEYAWDNDSFPIEEAFSLRQDPRFRGNVGIIAVGLSDAHILKMLDDPTIDQVIPYHKSGMPESVQIKTGLKNATDYTDQQTTGGKPKKAADFNFNEAVRRTGDPRKAASEYVKWCEMNGYTPKFEQFKDHPNYYKVLADFRLFDNEGKYSEQEAVNPGKILGDNWKQELEDSLNDKTMQESVRARVAGNEKLMKDVERLMSKQRMDGAVRDEMVKKLKGALGKDNVESLKQNEFFNALEDAYKQTIGAEQAKAKVEVLRTTNGVVYGFASGGKITLNENVFNAETPIHEFTHIWVKVAQRENAKLWKKGKDLLKQTGEWQEVMNDDLYADIRGDEDAVASEVLARIVGSEGADYVRRLLDPEHKPLKQGGVYNQIKEWLREMFNNVRSLFAPSIRNLTYDEFVNMPLKTLFDEAEAKRFLEAKARLESEGRLEGDVENEGIELSVVKDPKEIERLEKEPVEYGYRNVSMKEDGTFRSPMADKLGKKGEKSRSTEPFKMNAWEKSDENPDLATDDGKINLIKPNGLGSVGAVDYNPYIHIRPTTLNKQFKNAWERNDLVYLKVAYPASELDKGYHAPKAKLSVGKHPWNGGELILSRWDKPMEIVPWEEVANEWVNEFKDRGVEFDIVPPKLLPILMERGVEILPPHKGMGKACNDAYQEKVVNRATRYEKMARGYETVSRNTERRDREYAEAVEQGDTKKVEQMVKAAAKAAGMATDESGNLIDLYHGTNRFGFTVFDRLKSRMGVFFTSSRSNVAANYGGDDHYAGKRKINKGYKQDDSQEGILNNARSVFDQDWNMATEEQKEAIVTKAEADARRIVDEIDKRKVDTTNLPADEELDIFNATAWVEDLFNTVAYAKENGNEGAELYRLVSDGVERYNENKQIVRDYYNKHYDELDAKQRGYLNYLTHWESGDVAIEIEYSYKNILSGKELATVDGNTLITLDSLKEITDEAHNIGSYHLYGNLGDNPLVVDADGKNWYSLEYDGRKFDTDTLAQYAKENGYTSLVVKNVYDYGDKADDYIFFDPEQIKSADPVTYDDAGNVIPLSERFNTEKQDIRYRLSGNRFSDDKEFEQAVKEYNDTLRMNERRANRQGADYYPTPAPLALVASRLLHAEKGMDVLDIGSGSGMLHKYIKEGNVTAVEASPELAEANRKNTDANVVTGDFMKVEDGKKYDRIITNPPYGQKGAEAFRHATKGYESLADGGRMVAILPMGRNADRLYNEFVEKVKADGGRVTADVELPSCTFYKAGVHGSRTRMIVVDKNAEGETEKVNLGGITTNQGLYEAIYKMDVGLDGKVNGVDLSDASHRIGFSRPRGEGHMERVAEGVEKANRQLGGNAKVVREADLGKDVPKNAQAWYDPNTGEVHVVAERVNGAEDASRAVWHEEIGHKAMSELLGDRYNDWLDDVHKLLGSEHADAMKRLRETYAKELEGKSEEAQNRLLADEWIAELAERGEKDLSTWQKVKGMFRNWLWKHFGVMLGDGDIDYMLHKALAERRKGYRSKAMMSIAERRRAEEGNAMAEQSRRYRLLDEENRAEAKSRARDLLEAERDELNDKKTQMEDALNRALTVRRGDPSAENLAMSPKQRRELAASIERLEKRIDALNDSLAETDLTDPERVVNRAWDHVGLATEAEMLMQKAESLMKTKDILRDAGVTRVENLTPEQRKEYDRYLWNGKIADARLTAMRDARPERPFEGSIDDNLGREPQYDDFRHPDLDRDDLSERDRDYLERQANDNYARAKAEWNRKKERLIEQLDDYEAECDDWRMRQRDYMREIVDAEKKLRADWQTDYWSAMENNQEADALLHVADMTGIPLTSKHDVKTYLRELRYEHVRRQQHAEGEDYKFIKEIESMVDKVVGTGSLANKVRKHGDRKQVMRDLIDMMEGTKEVTEEMKPIVKKIQQWFDDMFEWQVASGLVYAPWKYRQGYVPHLWNIDASRPDADAAAKIEKAGGLVPTRMNSPFMNERFYDTYEEGIQHGLVPKHESIIDLIKEYSKEVNKAVSNRQALDILRFVKAPIETEVWVEQEGGGKEKVTQTQWLPIVIDAGEVPPKGVQYNAYKNSAFYKDGTPQFLILSPRYVKGTERNIYSMFGEQGYVSSKDAADSGLEKALGAADKLGQTVKQTNLSFSAFHAIALTEHMLGASKNPLRSTKRAIYDSLIESVITGKTLRQRKADVAEDAMSHFVKMGNSYDFDKSMDVLTKLSDMINNPDNPEWRKFVNAKNDKERAKAAKALIRTVFGSPLKLVKMLKKGNDFILWDMLHDGYKLSVWDMRSKYLRKQAEKKGWSEAELNRRLDDLGQTINDMFGGQHWELLNASPRTMRNLRLAFLSPDWNASWMRLWGRMAGMGKLRNDNFFRGLKNEEGKWQSPISGKAIQKAWKENHAQYLSMTVMGMSALMAFVGYSLMNLAMRKKDIEEELAKAEEIRKTDPNYKSPYEEEGIKPITWENFLGRANEWILSPWNALNDPGKGTYVYIGKDESGRGRYLRPGKQMRELFELFLDEKDHLDLGAWYKAGLRKMNPLVGVGHEMMTGYSTSGWENKELTKTTGWERELNRLKYVALHTMLPMSLIDPVEKGDTDKMWWRMAYPVSKGMGWYKGRELLEDAIRNDDDQMVNRVRRAYVLNGMSADFESAYSKALGTIRKEKAKEEGYDDKTPSELFEMAAKSNDPKMREKLLEKAKEQIETTGMSEGKTAREAMAEYQQKTEKEGNYLVHCTAQDMEYDTHMKIFMKKAEEDGSVVATFRKMGGTIPKKTQVKKGKKVVDSRIEWKGKDGYTNADCEKFYKEHEDELIAYYRMNMFREGYNARIKEMKDLKGKEADAKMEEIRKYRDEWMKYASEYLDTTTWKVKKHKK